MSATFSEVFGDNPLHLHRTIPLDFLSVKTVPDSHVWPKSGDDLEYSDDVFSIPLIDLKNPDAANQIEKACETWGVFQVTNHNVPLDLLQEVESKARSLFSLPFEQKLKALRTPGASTGYGVARISPFFNKYLWHEGFTVVGSPVDHARKLWPYSHQLFCDVIDDYQKKMKELARTLVQTILNSLGIISEDEDIMNRMCSPENVNTALQLNSYPSCPDPNRAMGLAPHTDTSLLTILHQSSTKGLQLFKEGVGWVWVRPINGALVVNIGDFLHILSNAKFPAVLHRVVMQEAKQRLSMAYFYSPPSDFRVSPLVLDSGQTPSYRSISVGEYIRFKAKDPDSALSEIRI
ncbi:hypothetical protein Tsubulata_012063 [Turnera subulata]|uniref:gibberellin 3beta-dioxygenase n=1 Tax=Turnera subulata TaxID=218843 RepID=A0A9Q0J5E4_9ROSI|nr:hypothetical protein Tsubulata_012063 [Turnera subulata]